MRVLLADNDADVRAALRLLLTHDLEMQVVAEVADASDLRTQAQVTRADLLLLDGALLGARASDVIANLRTLSPCPRIVVLSAHPEARTQALAFGADAFVSKADEPAQLVTTLRALSAPGCAASTGDGGTANAPERAGA